VPFEFATVITVPSLTGFAPPALFASTRRPRALYVMVGASSASR